MEASNQMKILNKQQFKKSILLTNYKLGLRHIQQDCLYSKSWSEVRLITLKLD